MARGLLGRDHPLQMRHQRRDALREADCVLLAGVPCDFRLDYGKHVRRSATLIAANRSAKDARLNRRPDVAAIGDAGAVPPGAGAGPARRRASRWAGWCDSAARARRRARGRDRRPGRAERRVRQPAGLLPRTGGRGRRRRHLRRRRRRLRRHRQLRAAPARPAHLARPGRLRHAGRRRRLRARRGAGAARSAEVWIVFGDGACGWGLAEFDTFVRHGIPVIAVVGNDAGWTQIAREQVKMLHDDVATVLARTAYHEVAAGFGAEGLLVQHSDRGAPGAAACARAGAPGQGGAGQRLARQDRVPRGVVVDVGLPWHIRSPRSMAMKR